MITNCLCWAYVWGIAEKKKYIEMISFFAMLGNIMTHIYVY